MLDTTPTSPPAHHVHSTLAAHLIGAIGLILAVLCLALVAGSIAFWSGR